MRYAIYRIHYGLDFLGKSIESVIDEVDKVFVFWSKQPWYKECENLPPLNENVLEFCEKYDKVIVIEKEFNLPDNQFKLMYDEVVSRYPKPEQTLMIEPDMVWDKEELKKVWELKDNEISFNQIEFWKNEKWYIKRDRPGPTLWNVAPKITGKGCWSNRHNVHPTIKCKNYGFCLNKDTMNYKHEVAIQSSKYYKDSQPSVEWYEKKWLNWTPETEDLEISEAHRHYIKRAYPYGT
jgi:hypothetical protein